VGRVHVGLDLEHERRERVVELAGRALGVDAGRRRRRQVDDAVEQQPHAEVGERRAHEHGRLLARQEQVEVDRPGHRVEQRDLVGGGPPGVALGRLGGRRVEHLLGRLGRPVGGAPVADEPAGAPVDQPPEVAGVPHRPRDRHRLEVEPRLDLVEQRQPVEPGPVPLVDEGEEGHVAGPAHLEELEGLGLDALGGVEDHDGGVDGGQHAVGVLGEVAVARGVEQVEDVVAVGELQHRRGDGDAPLLLELHPVGPGPPPLAPGLDLAGLLHRPPVEQELLGQGGLARVGVADDRERAPVRREVGGLVGHATDQLTDCRRDPG
jgi:hypothetical protein